MGTTKKDDTTTPETEHVDTDAFGQDEVQSAIAQEQEQGFRGTKVDPFPNSAHSLESGPESPSVVETRAALASKNTKEA